MVVTFCLLSCGQKVTPDLQGSSGSEEETPGQGGHGTKNWTTKTISDGLLLHMFTGEDKISNGSERTLPTHILVFDNQKK